MTPETLTHEFLELERAFTQAIVDGDRGRVLALMTRDFSITTAGWLDTPADGPAWLEHAFERFRLEAFTNEDLRVRRHGDVVVVQLRSLQRGLDLATGQPWAMVLRYTDVWIRDGARWQIDVRQATGRPWQASDGDIG
jgi:ketosteroid isomerase-like protein